MHPHPVHTPTLNQYTHFQSIHHHPLYTCTPLYTPTSSLYTTNTQPTHARPPAPLYTYFLVRSGFMWQYHLLGTGSEAKVGRRLHFMQRSHCTQVHVMSLKQFSSHSHSRRPHGCNITSNGTRPTFSQTICSIVAELAVPHF